MSFDGIFSDLATAFSAQFGGPYHDGWASFPGTPTLDTGGSITTPATPVVEACNVQVDVATEAMRADAGFLATDVRLLVLGLAALDTSAEVTVGDDRYAVQSVARDPAGIGWEARGRKLP